MDGAGDIFTKDPIEAANDIKRLPRDEQNRVKQYLRAMTKAVNQSRRNSARRILEQLGE